MWGDPGSTVSWYLMSERSSMRPPLSGIDPATLGVSMRTRGEAASASSRVIGLPGTAPGRAGAVGAGGGGRRAAQGLAVRRRKEPALMERLAATEGRERVARVPAPAAAGFVFASRPG